VPTLPQSSTTVELCGLPGSGKTTLAAALRQELARRGVPCTIADRELSASVGLSQRLRRRAGSALRQSARHPRATASATAALLRSGQSSARDTAAYLAQWLAVRDLVAVAHRSPGAHLLEEGIVQRLWTLGLRGTTDVSPRLWQGLGPEMRTDLVVVIDVPTQVALRRLDGRDSRHSRTQRLDPDLRLAELDPGRRLLDELLSASPVPVMRVNGQVPTDELAVEVGRTVLALVESRTGRDQ
jgi:thymidylate kinase